MAVLYKPQENGGIRFTSERRPGDVRIPNYVYDLWLPVLGVTTIGVYTVYCRLERESVVKKMTLADVATACRIGKATLQKVNDTLQACGFIKLKSPKGKDKLKHFTTEIIVLDPPIELSKTVIDFCKPNGDYKPLAPWLVHSELPEVLSGTSDGSIQNVGQFQPEPPSIEPPVFESSGVESNTSLQPPAGASVADTPEVAAKAVAPEAKRESSEPVKDKVLADSKNLPPGKVLAAAAKKPKAPQPADPLFNAIGEHVFKATDKASVAAVASRIALIMNGDKKTGRCIGIIDYECLRQSRERNELDYNQLAQDVGTWKRWHDTNKTFTVKDCVTVLDSWQEWRGNGGSTSEPTDEWRNVEVKNERGIWVERRVHRDMLATLEWREVEWTRN